MSLRFNYKFYPPFKTTACFFNKHNQKLYSTTWSFAMNGNLSHHLMLIFTLPGNKAGG